MRVRVGAGGEGRPLSDSESSSKVTDRLAASSVTFAIAALSEYRQEEEI